MEMPPTHRPKAHSSAAHGRRSRRRLIDAMVAGGAALGLITAANAALPRLEHGAAPPRPRLAQVPHAPPPAPPKALIAFQYPEPGYPVVSPFGLRQLPWEESGRLHAGIDIAAPSGLPVVAAADGVVTRMEIDAGYGRFVELKHAAGLSTVYAHLSRFQPQIALGMAVKAGEALGELGSTGSSTGAHLHFEVRDERGRPLNPELFLGRSFAEAADLPLRAAAKIPRGVRVAFVSNIPKARREEMQARLDGEMQLAAADASQATQAGAAANAAEAAVDASASGAHARTASGRPHARLRLRE